MRLRELGAKLIWKVDPKDFTHWTDCTDASLAQGVQFACPKCFVKNGNSFVGTHWVTCWFNNRGVPDKVRPAHGGWNASGKTIDDLTFVPPGATSVLLTGPGCGWHAFIENGGVRMI